jgi:hypothetical protein
MYRGRLFAGSGYEGVIYASEFKKKGKYVSKPFQTQAKEITHEKAVPEGTSLKFKIRSGSSLNQTVRAPWREKTAIPDGHTYVQYMAEFTSDGKKTPVLKNIKF